MIFTETGRVRRLWRVRCLRFGVTLVAAATMGSALGACDDDQRTGAPATLVTLNVGVLPIADVAPLYLGREKGFFTDENLAVEPRVAGSGAMVPSVLSGDFQFGWVNTTSLITARSKGLPLRMLRHAVLGGATPEESSADILVRSDGPVRSPKDLEGRTISVAGLQSISTLTANAALEKQGVDVSKVKYIEVPFPQAVAALEASRVDAAYVAEPFATLGLRAGHRSISRPIHETAPNYIVAAYVTTEAYIAEHMDVVDRFDRAVNRSFDYARAHPDEIRRVLLTYSGIAPEVAMQIRLPDYSRITDASTLDLTAELAKKYGYIEKAPDISGLLYEP